jgi:hypothetical protein
MRLSSTVVAYLDVHNPVPPGTERGVDEPSARDNAAYDELDAL